MPSELIPHPASFGGHGAWDMAGDYVAHWGIPERSAMVLEARCGGRTGQVVITHEEIASEPANDVMVSRLCELVDLLCAAADVDGATPDR